MEQNQVLELIAKYIENMSEEQQEKFFTELVNCFEKDTVLKSHAFKAIEAAAKEAGYVIRTGNAS